MFNNFFTPLIPKGGCLFKTLDFSPYVFLGAERERGVRTKKL